MNNYHLYQVEMTDSAWEAFHSGKSGGRRLGSNKYITVQAGVPDPSSFTAIWGRVGETKRDSKVYPIGKLTSYIHSKTRKGYVDLSHLQVAGSAAVNYGSDDIAASLLRDLQEYSSGYVRREFNVSSVAGITPAMITSAREHLERVRQAATVDDGNAALLALYHIVPRAMGDVGLYLAHNMKELGERIQEEADALDALETQVKVTGGDVGDNTIADKLGISVRLATNDEYNEAVAVWNNDDDARGLVSKIRRVYAVENRGTRSAYSPQAGDRQLLLCHASANRNWLSILSSGLSIAPPSKVNGRAFGNGTYFGKPYKAAMYADSGRHGNGRGYVGMYQVNLGANCMSIHHNEELVEKCRSTYPSLYRASDVNPVHVYGSGYTSVHAQSGGNGRGRYSLQYDEWIVFDNSHSDIRYLVEF